MAKQKLYFENKDSDVCYPLSYFIDNAKLQGIESVSLYEALEDNDFPDMHFCQYYGEIVDNCDCKKSECNQYTSMSGRGKCQYRGKVYFKSIEKITFKVF